jgi:hypothetical protein
VGTLIRRFERLLTGGRAIARAQAEADGVVKTQVAHFVP